MRVTTVFNNNVVLAVDELGRDVVLTVRGVGFQQRRGGAVDPELVQRVFVPADNPASVGQMIAAVPPERFALINELFAQAVASLGARLPPLALIAAVDHIHQAIERVGRGEIMEYPLRAEVAYLHPEELRVAEELVRRLNDELGPKLPEGEAFALAMHLFHAVTGTANMEETFVHSGLIRQVFDLVAQVYGPEFDSNSIDAARFATHLRYFFVRARGDRQLEAETGGIGAELAAQNPGAYRLAERIQALLELRLGSPVSADEVGYLTLHVARLEMGMRRAAR
ncbi:transcriptional antiterminator, BglG family [Tessaracoccus bendigoensis DSM 12906]|uniref:Transcriptional antiterminator, BglG family n=1 Tax=Tessaracoccus bendigoensis DSM 12906 TaxID=1123357 RepID=A0A1M6HXC1_9ACTN|nr:PRD domain-containing protein [Tessaracoccus bendigoensis]SHJ26707.1 transcriptional antiterminator, BglG family [Tessaracoccus bendigoensis DSM 12906]